MSEAARKNLLVNLGLIAGVVVIFLVSFLMAPRPSGPDDEAFAGTDAVVTQVIEDEGYEPWLQPIFEPGSGEIESGLFALQAALGAGVLGYVLGNLRGRNKARQEAATPVDQPA